MQVGATSNRGMAETDYAKTINNRWSPNNNAGNYADFDQSYSAVGAGGSQGNASAYTVQDGDTLQAIATKVWGDSSLWYLIADANGLNGTEPLVGGRTLSIPGNARNVHNSAVTFKPYDPNIALGNNAPSRKKPPKPMSGFAMVIVALIAMAVVAIVAPYAVAAMSSVFPGAAGAVGLGTIQTALAAGTSLASIPGISTAALVAGSAIAGAAGSIVSQGFAVATGMQEKFDWKAVGMAAIGSGVSAGLGRLSPFKVVEGANRWVNAGNAAANGALSSVITQGVGVATGLQDKFSWSSVAVQAVGAGVGSVVGSYMPEGTPAWISAPVSSLVGGVVGVGAQTLIEGNSFGDNLRSALPGMIANTIGAMVEGLAASKSSQTEPEKTGPVDGYSVLKKGGDSADGGVKGAFTSVSVGGKWADSAGDDIKSLPRIVSRPFSDLGPVALFGSEQLSLDALADVGTLVNEGPIFQYDEARGIGGLGELPLNSRTASFTKSLRLTREDISALGLSDREEFVLTGGPPPARRAPPPSIRTNRRPNDIQEPGTGSPGSVVNSPVIQTVFAPIDGFLGWSASAGAAVESAQLGIIKTLRSDIRDLDPNWRFPPDGVGEGASARYLQIEGLYLQRAYLRYRTTGSASDVRELQEIVGRFIQRRVDVNYAEGVRLYQRGKLAVNLNPNEAIGNYVDREVRGNLRTFFAANRVPFGRGNDLINVNNRVYETESTYRIPDSRVGDVIFEVTLSRKTGSSSQVQGFLRAAPDTTAVVIIRPSQLGYGGKTASASYLILPQGEK